MSFKLEVSPSFATQGDIIAFLIAVTKYLRERLLFILGYRFRELSPWWFDPKHFEQVVTVVGACEQEPEQEGGNLGQGWPSLICLLAKLYHPKFLDHLKTSLLARDKDLST